MNLPTFALSVLLFCGAFWLAFEGPDDQLTGAAVAGFIGAIVAINTAGGRQ